MDISIIGLISGVLAIFMAGIAVGRLVEKINSFISDSKKDRPSAKK